MKLTRVAPYGTLLGSCRIMVMVMVMVMVIRIDTVSQSISQSVLCICINKEYVYKVEWSRVPRYLQHK